MAFCLNKHKLAASQQVLLNTPQLIGLKKRYNYVYVEIKTQVLILILTIFNMLYDTYGEEYLAFLQDLNEILSINELVELDFM
ncbi:hypothetical protein [Maribacter sp.]|nr:hypothetical protein [Maribacter sp.]